MIVTPFLSHNVLSIFPISAFSFPYIACLRYLGANTIWYLHLHFECDKLLMSVFIAEPSYVFICGCQTTFIITQESYSIAKAFFTYPQYNWGFCLAYSAHNQKMTKTVLRFPPSLRKAYSSVSNFRPMPVKMLIRKIISSPQQWKVYGMMFRKEKSGLKFSNVSTTPRETKTGLP